MKVVGGEAEEWPCRSYRERGSKTNAKQRAKCYSENEAGMETVDLDNPDITDDVISKVKQKLSREARKRENKPTFSGRLE